MLAYTLKGWEGAEQRISSVPFLYQRMDKELSWSFCYCHFFLLSLLFLSWGSEQRKSSQLLTSPFPSDLPLQFFSLWDSQILKPSSLPGSGRELVRNAESQTYTESALHSSLRCRALVYSSPTASIILWKHSFNHVTPLLKPSVSPLWVCTKSSIMHVLPRYFKPSTTWPLPPKTVCENHESATLNHILFLHVVYSVVWGWGGD